MTTNAPTQNTRLLAWVDQIAELTHLLWAAHGIRVWSEWIDSIRTVSEQQPRSQPRASNKPAQHTLGDLLLVLLMTNGGPPRGITLLGIPRLGSIQWGVACERMGNPLHKTMWGGGGRRRTP